MQPSWRSNFSPSHVLCLAVAESFVLLLGWVWGGRQQRKSGGGGQLIKDIRNTNTILELQTLLQSKALPGATMVRSPSLLLL